MICASKVVLTSNYTDAFFPVSLDLLPGKGLPGYFTGATDNRVREVARVLLTI